MELSKTLSQENESMQTKQI